MAADVVKAPLAVIRRLLRMESGVRKCARILLFMGRKQAVEALSGLPAPVLVSIAREIAKLKGQIVDMHKEYDLVREQLGVLTNVIDLTPSNPRGSNAFAFLEEADADALAALAGELDERALAAVICNAPIEAAVVLLGTIKPGRLRAELVEEMTRLKTSGKRAMRLAEETRAALVRIGERRKENARPNRDSRRGGGVQRSKRGGAGTTAAGRVSPAQGGATRAPAAEPPLVGNQPSLRELLTSLDQRELQRILGAVPLDHLALALGEDTPDLEALLRLNLSPRRFADLTREREAAGAVDPPQARAAQWAIVNRILKALDETRKR